MQYCASKWHSHFRQAAFFQSNVRQSILIRHHVLHTPSQYECICCPMCKNIRKNWWPADALDFAKDKFPVESFPGACQPQHLMLYSTGFAWYSIRCYCHQCIYTQCWNVSRIIRRIEFCRQIINDMKIWFTQTFQRQQCLQFCSRIFPFWNNRC